MKDMTLASFGSLFIGMIIGLLFGGVGTLVYLGERFDLARRMVTVLIVFIGTVVVFIGGDIARNVIMAIAAGIIIGGLGIVFKFSNET